MSQYGFNFEFFDLQLCFSAVTGTIDYPSGSKILFNDEAIVPMRLYFYCLPHGSQPWGYWSVDDRPSGPQDLEDTTISFVK
jgi:hypothetical protein